MSLKNLELVYDDNLDKWVYIDKRDTSIIISNKKIVANRYLRNGFYPQEYSFIFRKRMPHTMCSYCGIFILTKNVTRDHIWPKSKGGSYTTPSCDSCNTLKKDMKPIEWGIEASLSGLTFDKRDMAQVFSVFEDDTPDGKD